MSSETQRKALQMKMRDMAIQNGMLETKASKGPNKYYPSFSFSKKTFPELADKEVGDECILCVKAKVVTINSDSTDTRITLDILKAGYEKDEESNKEYDDEEDGDME